MSVGESSSIPVETIDNFNELAQGGSWDELKKKLVQMPPLEEKVECLKQMQELVRVRDLIDYVIYREAVLRIFPSTHFTVTPRASGKVVTTPDGQKSIVDKWYTLEVTNSSEPPIPGVQTGKCTIKVHAPGSRKVTSDIDTSILTTISGNFSTSHAKGTPAVPKIAGASVAKRISDAVIDGFYHLSEEVFDGVTSSTHRDSNAYIDVLTNDAEEYPQFKYDDYNPVINGDRLFTKGVFEKTFIEYKRCKHIQEQAASLFSLRLSLQEGEWRQFKEMVDHQWQTVFSDFELKPTHMKEDWEAIFDKVEKLHSDYLKVLGDSEGEDRIKLMNKSYVAQLEKCADLDEKIHAAEQEKKRLIDELKAQHTTRAEAEMAWKELPQDSKNVSTRAFVTELQLIFAKLHGDYVELERKLKACIHSIAVYRLDKQIELIKASTFANEAYVCRSAVYHVVNAQKGVKFGLEKDAEFRMTEQTFLSSALQQVGFKLLHAHELSEKGKTPGEVAYLTAKYGQRIFNLIFNQQMTSDNKPIPVSEAGLESLAKRIGRNKFGTFSWLKSENLRDHFYRVLDREELLILNYQAKLIAEVKDKASIAEDEKTHETLKRMLALATSLKIEGSDEEKVLRFQEKERQIFLSLAAKLIAIVCASKIERQQHLWGYEPENSPISPQAKTATSVESVLKVAPQSFSKASTPSATPSIPHDTQAVTTSHIDNVHLVEDARGTHIIGHGSHGHVGIYRGEGTSHGVTVVGHTSPEIIEAAIGKQGASTEKK